MFDFLFKELKWGIPVFMIPVILIGAIAFFGLANDIHQEMNEPKSGKIYAMEYTPAHTEYRSRTTTDYNGNTHTTQYPVQVPDRYEIKYEQFNRAEDKFDKGDAIVDETTYHSHKIGEHFVNTQ